MTGGHNAIDLAREPDFRIGPVQVRPGTRQIQSNGAPDTLEPRIMQVLIALARRRGEVVSRDELIETCWEGRVVGDDALNRCISKVRKIGEASGAFRLETIPRVGYRMHVNGDAAASRRSTPGRQWPLPAMIAGGVATALGLAALVYTVTANSRVVEVTPPSQRVAFFGFTAADENPLSARIAAEATDQTFAELSRMSLDAAAKTATLGPSADDRLTRAETLGAAYVLSGEVRTEGEEARFSIQLEDAATRATLWESRETSPVGRRFYSPPKQAAFRAAANTRCVVALRAELSRESPEALQAIVDYCARPFGSAVSTDGERNLLALRSLAKLEPRSAFLQTSLASMLVYTASGLPAGPQSERLQEADDLLTNALRITPGYSYSVATAELALNMRGGSPLESEQLLATARPGEITPPEGSAYAEAILLYRRGINLLGAGRTGEGVALLRAAQAAQPPLTQLAAFQAYGLASQDKAADAELLFEQIFASEPGGTLVWPVWASAAVLEGVGDAEAVMAAAPENVPRATVACWRAVLFAKKAGEPGPPPDSLRDCGPVMSILAALGQVGEAFDLYHALPRQYADTLTLFAPFARPMREDKRFLPLVEKLGLWEYWIATGSHPDVCDLPAEKDFEFCVQLRKEQAK